MESYEVFIQRHLSQLRQCNSKSSEYICKTNNSNSEITFYGCPILPPLLSLEQREEMCRYRAMAKGLMNETTMYSPGVSDGHNIPNSVQIKQSPTLKEFSQEVDTTGNTSRISCISKHPGSKQEVMKYPCSPILSSTGLTDDWKVDVDACDVSVQGSHSGGPTVHKSCEGLEIHHLTLDPHSDVCPQALSTGDMPSETHLVGTSIYNDGVETERFGRERSSKIDFALQKPAHAISLGPSIINHVPMDAQALEECMVATPTQMEDSLQTHTDQDRCLSGVNPSEGPCCTGLQKLSTQTPAHKWELQTLIRQDRNDTLPVLSPAEESVSDKENEDISEEDVVGSGEHKRPRGERQEQGGVQTPEAEKRAI
ncbi:uncharacterized protein si:ch73-100l22.3 isoform X5 [Clupea harengus]|nr:uncharacterized protein si:ch73-100l22.3 isoform X5 [Clupea harengus]XP_042564743.1 uncharacterized protein si:ch73-100l22.3 isoform X5 [Clupea harengus]